MWYEVLTFIDETKLMVQKPDEYFLKNLPTRWSVITLQPAPSWSVWDLQLWSRLPLNWKIDMFWIRIKLLGRNFIWNGDYWAAGVQILDFRHPPLKLSRGGFHVIRETVHPLLGKPDPHRLWDTKNGVCYYYCLLLLLLLATALAIVIVIVVWYCSWRKWKLICDNPRLMW